MEDIYKQLENALKTIPEIKWIDADAGQTSIQPAPLVYPAALIAFDEHIVFGEMAGKKQKAYSDTAIKLVFKDIEKSNAKVPDNFKEIAFKRFRLVKTVSDIISTLQNTHRTELRKRSYNGLIIYEIYFTINFID